MRYQPPTSMHTTTVLTTTSRPNRILIALATAWMILSIAIGGAVSAETTPDATVIEPVTAVQP